MCFRAGVVVVVVPPDGQQMALQGNQRKKKNTDEEEEVAVWGQKHSERTIKLTSIDTLLIKHTLNNSSVKVAALKQR